MRRFLQYALIFVIVFIGSCGFMVGSHLLSRGDSTLQQNQIQTEQNPVVSNFIDKIMNFEQLSTNINLTAANGDKQLFALSGNLLLNNTEGTDLSLDFEASIGETNLTGTLLYKNGYIYVDVNGMKFKISTQTLMEDIKIIIGALGINLPTDELMSELGIDLNNLDMAALTGMLNEMKTTETDEGFELELALPVGVIHAALDKSYNLTDININKLELGGYTASLVAQTNFQPENIEIKEPANKDEIHDMSPLVEALKLLSGQYGKKAYNVGMNLSFGPLKAQGVIQIDAREELIANVDLKINSMDCNFKFTDNTLYCDIDGVKLSTTVDDIVELWDFLKTNLGNIPAINQEMENIEGILADLISQMKAENNELHFGLKDLIDVTLTKDENGELKSIRAQNSKLNATFDVGTIEELDIPAPNPEEYVQYNDLWNVVQSIIEEVMSGKTCATLRLGAGVDCVTAKIKLDYQDTSNVKVYATVHILGKDLEVCLYGDKLYLSYDGLKTYIYLNEFGELSETYLAGIVSGLLQRVASSDTEIGNKLNSIMQLISGTVDIQKLLDSFNLKSVEKLQADENGLSVTLSSGLKFGVVTKDKVLQELYVSFGKVYGFINMCAAKVFEIEDKDITQYTHYSEILNAVELAVKNLEGLKFNIPVTVSFNDKTYSLAVNVDLNNGLKLSATGQIDGHDIKITLINNEIFVNIDDIYVSADTTDITKVLEIAARYTNFDPSEILNILIKYNESLGNFNLNTLLNMFGDINIDLEKIDLCQLLSGDTINSLYFQNGILQLSLNLPVKLELTLNNGSIGLNVQDITVKDSKLGISATLNKSETSPGLTAEERAEYLDVQVLLDTVIKGDQINIDVAGSGSITVGELNLPVKYAVKYAQTLSAYVEIDLYGQILKAQIQNNIVYVSTGNLKFCMGLEELPQILEQLKSMFGFEIPQSNISLQSINSVVVNSRGLSISLNSGMSLSATITSGKLSQINANLGTVTAKLEVGGAGVIPEVGTGYTRVADVLPFIKAIKSQLDLGKIAALATVQINDLRLAINVWADYRDLNSPKLRLTTNALGQDIEIFVSQGRAYVTVDGVKLYAEISELADLITTLSGNADLGAGLGSVAGSLSSTVNINDVLQNIAKSGLLNRITFATDSQVLNIGVDNVTLSLALVGEKLSAINLNYNNIQVDIAVGENNAFELTDKNLNEFAHYTQLVTQVQQALATLQSMRYSIPLQIELNGKAYSLDVEIDINNGLQLSVVTQIDGRNINLTVLNNEIFVSMDNIKVKGNIADIKDVLSVVAQFTNIDIDTVYKYLGYYTDYIDMQTSLVDTIKRIIADTGTMVETPSISEILNMNIIKGISFVNGKLSADLTYTLNNIVLNALIGIQEGTLSINIPTLTLGAASIKLDAQVSALHTTPTLTEAQKADYLNLRALLDFIGCQGGKFNINLAGGGHIVIDNQTILLNYIINYTDTLNAYLEFKLLGQTAKVHIVNTKVYLQLDEIRVWADLKDINKIISEIETKFNVDLSSALNTGSENSLLSKLKNFGLNNITQAIVGSTQVLVDTDLGLKLNIAIVNDQVNTVDLNISSIVISLRNDSQITQIPAINIADYASYDVILDLAAQVYGKINNLQVTAGVDVTMNGTAYHADMKLRLNQGFDAHYIDFETAIKISDYDIKFNLRNGVVYIQVNDLKLKFNIDSSNKIISVIGEFIPDLDVGAILDVFNIDYSNLTDEILHQMSPGNDSKNVLFLDLIKNISFDNTTKNLKVTVTGGQTVELRCVDGLVSQVLIGNVDIQGIKLGVETTFQDALEFTPIVSSDYMDVSTIADMITIVKNTYDSATEYRFHGNLTVNIKGLSSNFADIGVNALIKVVKGADGSITPYVTVHLTDLPLSDYLMKDGNGLVFNREKYRNRRLTVSIADGNMYVLRTVERKKGTFSSEYENITEVKGHIPLSAFQGSTSDMLKYVQVIVGYANIVDWGIQQGIKNAEPPQNCTYEKWIVQNGYSYDAVENCYTIILDGAYMTQNTDVNYVTLNIYGNDKNMLNKLNANIGFANNFVTINLTDFTFVPSLADETFMQGEMSGLIAGTAINEYSAVITP